jgi:hypothetical protein
LLFYWNVKHTLWFNGFGIKICTNPMFVGLQISKWAPIFRLLAFKFQTVHHFRAVSLQISKWAPFPIILAFIFQDVHHSFVFGLQISKCAPFPLLLTFKFQNRHRPHGSWMSTNVNALNMVWFEGFGTTMCTNDIFFGLQISKFVFSYYFGGAHTYQSRKHRAHWRCVCV